MRKLNKPLLVLFLLTLSACAVEPEVVAEVEVDKVETPAVVLAEISPEQQAANKKTIQGLIAQQRIPIKEIEQFGYRAIPILTELYKEADNNQVKSRIAHVFWRLGWKSSEIEKALIDDLDSNDANLKVQVQWGIAKSSNSSKVLDKVLYNSQNDPSAFVRDKAACALASDFKHISSEQRLTLLRGLVDGLGNDILQVRGSSLQALQIQTGQSKGFNANADAGSRARSIAVWNEWLDEYGRNL